MKKHLITLGLVVAVLGVVGSVLLEDVLFAVSFIWAIVYGVGELTQPSDE